MSDKVIPGTHSDVWILTEPQHVIVCHYPNMPDFSGLFNSSSFFFDYQAAIDDDLQDMKDKISSGEYRLNTGHPSMVSPTQYALTHRWALIFLAWKQYLLKTKQRPSANMFPHEYTSIMLDPGYWVDTTKKRIYNPEFVLSSHPEHVEYWGDLSPIEQMNTMSPISYFPPMSYTNMFDDIVLYKPGDTIAKLASMYSYQGAIQMYNHAVSQHKTIKYSDILQSRGNGFHVDFSVLGRDVQYDLPDPLQYFSRSFLEQHAYSLGRKKSSEPYKNYSIYRIRTDVWPLPNYAVSQMRARDTWIQYWLKGGPIPLTPTSHVTYTSYGNTYYNVCPYLNDVYQYYLIHVTENPLAALLGAMFKIGTVISTIAISIATEQYHTLITTTMNIITDTIKQHFPSIGKYVDMAVILVIAPIINKNFPAPKNRDDATKLIMSMGSETLKNKSESFINDFFWDVSNIVKQVDEQLTARQKQILATISYRLDSDVTTVADTASTSSGNAVKNELDKKDEKNISSEYLLAGGIIGTALLLKKFLK